MASQRFLLVDPDGTPRDDRYQSVAREIGTRLQRMAHLDPADLDTLLGTTGDKVAARERKWGRLQDFPGFKAYFWKAFLHELASLLGRSEYKVKRRAVELEEADQSRQTPFDEWKNDDLVNLHARLLSEDIFRDLSDRDRKILLMKEEGYKAKQIAKIVGTTEGNVNVIVTRARKLAKSALSIPRGASPEIDNHRNDGSA